MNDAVLGVADGRAHDRAALGRAARSAFPPGEYVGQESFMGASEIRRLAQHAGIGPDVRVLDLCCGVAGPGRLITAEFGCRYLGVDRSPTSVRIAGQLAADLPCRFESGRVPPLPAGRFDVVLLLETMLAFPDKRALLAAVAGALSPTGRFAFTVEEGAPLTAAERRQMPAADTVWPVELAELTQVLGKAGLVVTWQQENSAAHQQVAAALARSFRLHADELGREIGEPALDALITSHELWSDWLTSGRVRKFAVVAVKR